MVVAVAFITPSLWGVVMDARTLGLVVEAWQRAGPHTTPMGKVREWLATAWWLGPLRPAPLRDPLSECGIPVTDWRELVALVVNIKARLACVQEQILLAEQEHEDFYTRVVVAACCLVAVPLCGALLMGCSCILLFLPLRRHQPLEETKDLQTYKGHTEDHLKLIQYKLVKRKLRKLLKQHCPLKRHVLLVMFDWLTEVQLPLDTGGDSRVPVTLLALGTLPLALQEEAHIQQRGQLRVRPVEDSAAPVEHTAAQEAGNEEAERLVRHSIVVPPRFRHWLAGAGEWHLRYLARHHCVMVCHTWDAPRGKLHIKGPKKHVLECHAHVQDLLAGYRAREAGPK